MAFVILHQAALASFPYYNWLKNHKEKLYLIVLAEKLTAFNESISDLPRGAYAQIHVVEGYDTSGDVDRLVLDIHAQDPVSAIVAQAEFDIERAARLRTYLRLPSQTEQSTYTFRNKVAMKECARAKGIPVADWIALDSMPSLLDFVEHIDFPVVVKPQNGTGSFNVRVLLNRKDLKAFATIGFTPPLDVQFNMMVENFVAGKVYHIDGLVVNGKTMINWPSIYATSSLDFLESDAEANASYLLHPENPLTHRLRKFVQDILDAFPTPQTCTFHAEVFHTDKDQLVLCEIASRTGGTRINDTIAACFDFNISEQWARAECRLPLMLRDEISSPRKLGGWVLIVPQPGKISHCPQDCNLPDLVNFTHNVAIGQTLSNPKTAIECIASFVFHADSEAASRESIKLYRRWLYEQFGIIKCA